ncbi:MAG TPA: aminodeoxychorismate lyase, partial [Roseiarcus sp.]|nr:aminodeoxychorismate lyase [Roseiarcus sp.]
SPQALAEQQGREARYGAAAATSGVGAQPAPYGKLASAEVLAIAMAAQSSGSSGRPRIYDASEGTALDPLLNTTYDLNYPKAVPTIQLR